MVAVSAYMGGTRCSGVLSSAGDVLEMSVVRGVGGVCDMRMCLVRGGAGCVAGEWVWALQILVEQGGKWDMCLCFGCGSVGGVVGEWLGGLGQGLGGWCGVKSVFVVSLYSLCRWQVQVSVYYVRRIPAHLRCTQCSILLQLIDICFLTCICLWQISQIQTCFHVFGGPGFVSTSPAFMLSCLEP